MGGAPGWMKYGKRRRDKSEPEIIVTLRNLGASVEQLADRDVPDLLVGYDGENYLVEVKTDQNFMSEGQWLWNKNWKGRKVVILHNQSEAIRWLSQLRNT